MILMSSIILLLCWSLMYIDESRNIPMGPAHFFFAANFSWQMLPLQKHSYKLYLLQTTSMKLMHPTGHSTYQVTNSGNKHKLLPWVSCIITNSSVSTFKHNSVANFNKFGHTFYFLYTIQATLSSSKPSAHHFPLVLHSMTHEKAGSQSSHLKYQSKFYPVFVQKSNSLSWK